MALSPGPWAHEPGAQETLVNTSLDRSPWVPGFDYFQHRWCSPDLISKAHNYVISSRTRLTCVLMARVSMSCCFYGDGNRAGSTHRKKRRLAGIELCFQARWWWVEPMSSLLTFMDNEILLLWQKIPEISNLRKLLWLTLSLHDYLALLLLCWSDTGEGGVSAFKVFNNNVKIQGLQDWECDSFPDLPDIFKDLGTMPSITKQ